MLLEASIRVTYLLFGELNHIFHSDLNNPLQPLSILFGDSVGRSIEIVSVSEVQTKEFGGYKSLI